MSIMWRWGCSDIKTTPPSHKCSLCEDWVAAISKQRHFRINDNYVKVGLQRYQSNATFRSSSRLTYSKLSMSTGSEQWQHHVDTQQTTVCTRLFNWPATLRLVLYTRSSWRTTHANRTWHVLCGVDVCTDVLKGTVEHMRSRVGGSARSCRLVRTPCIKTELAISYQPHLRLNAH